MPLREKSLLAAPPMLPKGEKTKGRLEGRSSNIQEGRSYAETYRREEIASEGKRTLFPQ